MIIPILAVLLGVVLLACGLALVAAVLVRRPGGCPGLLVPDPAPGVGEIIHLLGTDAVGSCQQWSESPGETYRALLQGTTRVRRIVHENAGYEVKHTGDGLFCVFWSPSRAANAALQIHDECNRHAASTASRVMLVRVGLQTACANTVYRTLDPVAHRQDFYGPPVDYLFRILASGTDLRGRRVVTSTAFVLSDHGYTASPIGVRTLRHHTPSVVPLYHLTATPAPATRSLCTEVRPRQATDFTGSDATADDISEAERFILDGETSVSCGAGSGPPLVQGPMSLVTGSSARHPDLGGPRTCKWGWVKANIPTVGLGRMCGYTDQWVGDIRGSLHAAVVL